MANWRKQHGETHHQVGRWRSSNFNSKRKPSFDNWHSTVPAWEKKFCTTVGSVPWGKLIECKKYMDLHSSVVNWDDSAGKEAFDNAKSRFWAEIKGLPCDISLPDPNMYIDNVDWNSSVDPELLLDLEKARFEDDARDEVSSGNQSQVQDLPICPTGWDVDVEEKPSDPLSTVVAQGWGYDLQENKGVDSWEQNYFPPAEPAKEYEWQYSGNDAWGWNHEQSYGVDFHNMGKGRTGGNTNWGAWDGSNRRRENMSWSKTNGHHHGNHMSRGRGNNRGRRRGSFAHVDKVPTATAWQVKT
ncbi:uncharacterized protein LOC130936831 [Arachis stenosperma]|uniref:uncharacterized protein LOC130936831 n=1 Tax=Arachis stenosperma TaxID=217475 RepID=UPI0025AC81FC|nr:uncharacterized protein LOC130936831 [Arachis stenosperma]